MDAPTRMQAAVSRGPRRIEVDAVPVPEPGAGEARVRVGACGICGSDLHLFEAGGLAPGLVPGHEMMGVVDAVGPGVSGVAPGARVAVEPFRTCGACPACRAGRGNLCPEAKLLGVHAPGGLAEYVVAPTDRLFPVPVDLADPVAALAEPLAVSVHGLRRAAFEPGQRVLVLGAGTVGLLTVLAARAMGAGDVWVSARHPHQAEAARAAGAHRVLDEAEAAPDTLGAAARSNGIDVAVETVGGRADTLAAAGAAIRPGGVVSVLGLFMAPVTLDTIPLLMKEATLTWSYCYEHGDHGADFADAVAILDRHREAASRLVSHTVPLAEAPRAFALAADRRAGALKVSVVPG